MIRIHARPDRSEGKEGTFMALSSAPLFFATLPVGLLSGYLLEVNRRVLCSYAGGCVRSCP